MSTNPDLLKRADEALGPHGSHEQLSSVIHDLKAALAEAEARADAACIVNRHVISVSVSGVANVAGTQCNFIRTALCDDGTMWENDDANYEWRQLPLIPLPPKESEAL